MHGRRRLPPGAENFMDEENKKAEKALTVVKAALSARGPACPEPVLTAATAVLTRNPEVYSLWNMRREAVAAVLEDEKRSSNAAQQELQLVGKCLEKNHKSYSAWHHRQWVLRHSQINLDTELASVEKHLNVVTGDSKNFHAWKYRSWLAERAGKSPLSEEEFTRNLLEVEPNNFSALHHRIVALAAAHTSSTTTDEHIPACAGPECTDSPMDEQSQAADACMSVDAPKTGAQPQSCTENGTLGQLGAKMHYSGARVLPISLDVLERELKALYEIVETDPANSAQWGYHLWLLRCATVHTQGTDLQEGVSTRVRTIFDGSKQQCEQIAAAETARMTTLQGRLAQHSAGTQAEGDGTIGESESSQRSKVGTTVMALASLAHQRSLLALADVLRLLLTTFKQESSDTVASLLEVYRTLQEVDPLRRGYYADQLAALA